MPAPRPARRRAASRAIVGSAREHNRRSTACEEHLRERHRNDVTVQPALAARLPDQILRRHRVHEALLIETGLEFDRAWMVVDADGGFVTQRELPRMALIRPTLKTERDGAARARHAGAAHRARSGRGAPMRVRSGTTRSRPTTWARCARSGSATSSAGRCAWCVSIRNSGACQPHWTGDDRGAERVPTAFRCWSPSSVARRAQPRLAAAGHAAVTMARFRPNLVLDGLDAHDEDHLDEIVFDDGGRPGAAEARQALRALPDSRRRPRHRRDRPRGRRHASAATAPMPGSTARSRSA